MARQDCRFFSTRNRSRRFAFLVGVNPDKPGFLHQAEQGQGIEHGAGGLFRSVDADNGLFGNALAARGKAALPGDDQNRAARFHDEADHEVLLDAAVRPIVNLACDDEFGAARMGNCAFGDLGEYGVHRAPFGLQAILLGPGFEFLAHLGKF